MRDHSPELACDHMVFALDHYKFGILSVIALSKLSSLLLDQLLRGAVVVFAGELAEADIGEVEFLGQYQRSDLAHAGIVFHPAFESLGHPCLRSGAELCLEGLYEDATFHAGVLDEFFCIALHFRPVVFHKVTKTYLCADQRTEELCHLGLGIVGDEGEEQLHIPGKAYLGVFHFAFSELGYYPVDNLFHVVLDRESVVNMSLEVAMGGEKVHQ